MWTWSLRERVDVFFELGEAQGPPDVAVRSIGLSQDDIILDRALKECKLGVDHEPSTTIDCLKVQPRFVPVSPRAHPLTTTQSELTLAFASYTENNTQYGHHVVEPPAQCPAWQPRRGGGCMAGLGLVLTLGSLSRRRLCRRVSDLAGTHDWTGLGLGHPLAWPGEPCVAHRHDGAGPLDHDRADRRTNGDDPLSRSDGTPLGGLLGNDLLRALQASEPAHRSLINRCNRQPSTSAAIRTPPQTQVRSTTSRSDRRRHRT